MKTKKRKIVLVIDNCTAHTDLPTLENVNVIFLPANTTSHLQPLDQGVIHSFKRYYRKEVVKHVLTCLQKNTKPEINVLLAIKFASKAWYAISDITIKNCFKKAGFCTDAGNSAEEDDVDVPSIEEWSTLLFCENSVENPTFEDFVRVDDNVIVAGELTEDDIIANLTMANNSAEEDDEENENLTVTEKPVPNKQETLKALETVHRFLEFSSSVDKSLFDKIYALEKEVENINIKKQTKITDLFNPFK
ncbi:tigger transposable element-derived protein 6-like [Leptopilina boulardi]|uniref:tigger transposable element-derived protein 6-like n=1 Tax=Leptopilina boulardi TaxID=63433 RepID=UPI0021F5BB2B|nr:tigger transposable element-derived protein 6-like [Leptopilina boulardi]